MHKLNVNITQNYILNATLTMNISSLNITYIIYEIQNHFILYSIAALVTEIVCLNFS